MHARTLAIAAALLWGCTYVLSTTLLPHNPLFIGAVRALGGAAVLFAITFVMPPAYWWRRMVVLGTLNAGLFFGLLFVAALRLPGGVAAIFQALGPMCVILLVWGLLAVKPTPIKVAGVLVGLCGVVLVVWRGQAPIDAIGVAAAVGSMLSLALGNTLTQKWGPPPMPLLAYTGWQLLVAGIELGLAALLVGDWPAQLSSANVIGLAVMALLITALPFALWFKAIAASSAVAVAPFVLVVPVTAFALDALVRDVMPSVGQLAGSALVMLGLWIGQRPVGKAPARP